MTEIHGNQLQRRPQDILKRYIQRFQERTSENVSHRRGYSTTKVQMHFVLDHTDLLNVELRNNSVQTLDVKMRRVVRRDEKTAKETLQSKSLTKMEQPRG